MFCCFVCSLAVLVFLFVCAFRFWYFVVLVVLVRCLYFGDLVAWFACDVWFTLCGFTWGCKLVAYV